MGGLCRLGMDDGRVRALGVSRVGVVGLGLIGGSIALDLRALGVPVQGLVHRASTAERATGQGAGGCRQL